MVMQWICRLRGSQQSTVDECEIDKGKDFNAVIKVDRVPRNRIHLCPKQVLIVFCVATFGLFLDGTQVYAQSFNDTFSNNTCNLSCSNCWVTGSRVFRRALGVEDKFICRTPQSCFDGPSNTSLTLQQHPLRLQLGDSVLFSLSLGNGSWHLSETNVNGFNSCNFTDVSRNFTTNQSSLIELNSGNLSPGLNYFIGRTSGSSAYCQFGLKIRIIVATEDCNLNNSVGLPCSSKGTCRVTGSNNLYSCECCPGYSMRYCSEFDGCSSSPCMNEGNCTDVLHGHESNFSCQCTPFFTGLRCETPIDYCSRSPCQNNSTCTSLPLEKRYACNCSTGYNGTNCENNINDCAVHNCSKNSICEDQINGYRCHCNSGWSGKFCQDDVNECQDRICKHNSTCTNSIGNFSCHCPNGLSGRFCEIDLIDECQSSPCKNNGSCKNMVGHFQCQCREGFNGTTCNIDLNECASNPCHPGGTSTCLNLPGRFQCVCHTGYTGKLCERDIDECISSPCANGGLCVNSINHYTCACQAGFFGADCQEVANKCSFKPCKNNATCQRTGDYLRNYTCFCSPGWSGRNCTVDINECASSPCLNNGTCSDMINSYHCACTLGWTGVNCEINIDMCKGDPCKNGANCTDLSTGLDYICSCPRGFSGKNCSQNIDECGTLNINCNNGLCIDLVDSYECNCSHGWFGKHCDTDKDRCQLKPCQNGGRCENENSTRGYKCFCPPGYTGSNCTVDIDDCSSNPCKNNASCQDFVNFYNCSCLQGFTGHFCETELDECISSPCKNNGTCLDLVGGFKCMCPPGYTGYDCGINVNECASSPCQNNGTCIDDVNRFSCKCTSGYFGEFCEKSICSTNPCRNGSTCIQKIDGYDCNCLPGFTGKHCDLDVNECLSSPCLNGGKCINQVNSFGCNCTYPYSGSRCENHICRTGVCLNQGNCTKLQTGFQCSCPQNFNGSRCEIPVGPCSTKPCAFNSTCRESGSSFYCTCSFGFEGLRCQQPSCPCMNGGRCIIGNNNLTHCLCPIGYTGVHCETFFGDCRNISNPNLRCLVDTQCTLTDYGYSCKCPSHLQGRQCNVFGGCAKQPCGKNGKCSGSLANIKCTCTPGYTGQFCEFDLNECLSSPCLNQGVCRERYVNDLICFCKPGFYGSFCQNGSSPSAALIYSTTGFDTFPVTHSIVSTSKSFVTTLTSLQTPLPSTSRITSVESVDLGRGSSNASLGASSVEYSVLHSIKSLFSTPTIYANVSSLISLSSSSSLNISSTKSGHSSTFVYNVSIGASSIEYSVLHSIKSLFSTSTIYANVSSVISLSSSSSLNISSTKSGHSSTFVSKVLSHQFSPLTSYTQEITKNTSRLPLISSTFPSILSISSLEAKSTLSTKMLSPLDATTFATTHSFTAETSLLSNASTIVLRNSTVLMVDSSQGTKIEKTSHPASSIIGKSGSSNMSEGNSVSASHGEEFSPLSEGSFVRTSFSSFQRTVTFLPSLNFSITKSIYQSQASVAPTLMSLPGTHTSQLALTGGISDIHEQATSSVMKMSTRSMMKSNTIGTLVEFNGSIMTTFSHFTFSLNTFPGLKVLSILSSETSTQPSGTPSLVATRESSSLTVLTNGSLEIGSTDIVRHQSATSIASLSQTSSYRDPSQSPATTSTTMLYTTSNPQSNIHATESFHASTSMMTNFDESSASTILFSTTVSSSSTLMLQSEGVTTMPGMSLSFSNNQRVFHLSTSVSGTLIDAPEKSTANFTTSNFLSAQAMGSVSLHTSSLTQESTTVISLHTTLKMSQSTESTLLNQVSLALSSIASSTVLQHFSESFTRSPSQAGSTFYYSVKQSLQSWSERIDITAIQPSTSVSSSTSRYTHLFLSSLSPNSSAQREFLTNVVTSIQGHTPMHSNDSTYTFPIVYSTLGHPVPQTSFLTVQTNELLTKRTLTFYEGMNGSHSFIMTTTMGDSIKSIYPHTIKLTFNESTRILPASTTSQTMTRIIRTSSLYSPCHSNPCINGGSCKESINGSTFTCLCRLGFEGSRCQLYNCPCRNAGRCVLRQTGNYECLCKVGFNGTFCENIVPDCRTYNCSRRGNCLERLLDGYVCVCDPSFYGIRCEKKAFNCNPNPCQNGGFCALNSNKTQDFRCLCPPGFQGQFCQFDFNECGSGPCMNNGKCREDKINDYTCVCKPGTSGKQCEVFPSTVFGSSYTLRLNSSLLASLKGTISTKPSNVPHETASITSAFFLSDTWQRMSHTTSDVFKTEVMTSNSVLVSSTANFSSSIIIPSLLLKTQPQIQTIDKSLSHFAATRIYSSSVINASSFALKSTAIFSTQYGPLHLLSSLHSSAIGTLAVSVHSYSSHIVPIYSSGDISTFTQLVMTRSSEHMSTDQSRQETAINNSIFHSIIEVTKPSSSIATYTTVLRTQSGHLLETSNLTGDMSIQQLSISQTTLMPFQSANGSRYSPIIMLTPAKSMEVMTTEKRVITTPVNFASPYQRSLVTSLNDFQMSLSPTHSASMSLSELSTMLQGFNLSSSEASYVDNTTYSPSELLFSLSLTYGITSTAHISQAQSLNESMLSDTVSFISTVLPLPTPTPTVIPEVNLTCQDSPCNGQVCVNESNFGLQYRCVCPHPLLGARCQSGIVVHFPLLSGNSYVVYNDIKFENVINTITVTFRTTVLQGLLIYAGHSSYQDFIQLFILHGRVNFFFNTGDETVKLMHPMVVSNGNLIMATARYDSRSKSGTLTINETSPVSKQMTSGLRSIQISTPWYIGGAPVSFHPVMGGKPSPLINFTGCIKDLQINEKPYRIVDAKDWLSVRECDVPACIRGPCKNNASCIQNEAKMEEYQCQCGTGYFGPNCARRIDHCRGDPCNGGICVWNPVGFTCLCQYGRHGVDCKSEINITVPTFGMVSNYSSYLEYGWTNTLRNSAERLELSMQFKIRKDAENKSQNGLMVYAGQSTISAKGDDFFALGISENHAVLIYNLGSGVAFLRSRYPIQNNRTWHRIAAGRRGSEGYLHLDDHPVIYQRSPGVLLGLDVYTPLYIGGVPDFSNLPDYVRAYFLRGFSGSIYDISIRTNQYHFIPLMFTMVSRVPSTGSAVSVERGLNIGDDSLDECKDYPCANNGTCRSVGSQFRCVCKSPWKGVLCRNRILPCVEYNPCLPGSTCTTQGAAVKCDCPVGKSGEFCDHSLNIELPLFQERSFLGLKPVDVKSNTNVFIRFKSSQPSGLLFYVAEHIESSEGDFFVISLLNRYIQVRFSLGGSTGVLKSRFQINLNAWHSLAVIRGVNEAVMQLDNNPRYGTRTSGNFFHLTVASLFYLGGVPQLSSLNPKAKIDISSQKDFQGCISALSVNNNVYNLSDVRNLIGRNIGDCGGKCSNNACANGAACVPVLSGSVLRNYTCACLAGRKGDNCEARVIGNQTAARFSGDSFILHQAPQTSPLSGNDIELVFSTTKDGLMLWLGQLRAGPQDYMALGVSNGYLRLRLSLNGVATEQVTGSQVVDAKNHTIQILRNETTVSLILDGIPVTGLLSSTAPLKNYGITYIGGVDGDTNILSSGQYKSGFNGCMSRLRLFPDGPVFNFNQVSLKSRNIKPCL